METPAGACPLSLHQLPIPASANLILDFRTRGGERLLRVWLCQPLTDKGKIQERLSIVEEFVNDSGARKMLHDNLLRRIPDFQSLSLKLENKKASLQVRIPFLKMNTQPFVIN